MSFGPRTIRELVASVSARDRSLRLVGLEGVQVEVAILRTPDGHGKLELAKFNSPSYQGDKSDVQANSPGITHVLFAVDDIDAAVAGLRARGAELVGEVERSATSAARRASSSSSQRRSADRASTRV